MFFCKTLNAVLLLGVEGSDGIIRFPSQEVVRRAPAGLPIVEMFIEHARQVVSPNLKPIDVHYWHQFAEPLGEEQTLFVARVVPKQLDFDSSGWITMPEWIRSLPKNRSRLPWLKAWQAYAGGYDQECRAVETDDKTIKSISET